LKFDFVIKEISRAHATDFVQSLHYSKVMPKLTKHFLGCYLENELVGVLTLGWGTQPKATIAKLFNDKNFCRIKFDGEKYVSDDLDTKDYYEIGKMCMKEEMPRTSESQMISAVVSWMKDNCPEKQFLYTWADGIMGKPGFVYQAANFLYGGFIWTQIYINNKGEKIHPRSSRRLCDENVQFKLEREPDFFVGKKGERIYWLTQDFLDHKGISKIHGKQFRYILPLNKKARKLLKKSKVKWTLEYPKEKDLVWDKSSVNGRERLDKMPHIDGDMTEYNSKNVNAHRGTLEAFL
tara:strand:+ start:444 stop:1322 length:879 start_codon:yes stop_codon:yes gene_type:complete